MAATGLIPAHAGKTLSTVAEMPSKRAHPRSRGENRRPRPLGRRRPGSSPLTRGKRLRGLGVAGLGGLIPAHAGKTQACSWVSPGPWAHPRSRGENAGFQSACERLTGSSPLTRGKRRWCPPGRNTEGLIPAHAGKTHPPRRAPRHQRAHPRSRGENIRVTNHFGGAPGSSPLTRGKQTICTSFARSPRLIPAHAGKTRSGQ